MLIILTGILIAKGTVDAIRKGEFVGFTFIFGGLLLFISVLVTNNPLLLHPIHTGQRYFYIPCVTFFWSLFWMIRFKPLYHLGMAMLVLLVVLRPSLYSKMELTDLHWAEYANRIGQQSVEIPINPGWTLHIPKERRAR